MLARLAKVVLLGVLATVSTRALCQAPAFPTAAELEQSLAFEIPPNGTIPGGWEAYPQGTIFSDDHIVHGGKYSARIERNSSAPFSTVTKMLPIDFKGKFIELRGHLRTEEVSEFAGLWLREDGDTPSLAFDNMQSRQLKGTTPWTEYSIKLPIDPAAKRLFFGALVAGTGKAWADDLHLFVDGAPVWDAPKVPLSKTILDTDHEFDVGSKIAVTQLSKIQIDNLVTLGKIWGFLKYHHPAVTSGRHQWDYELLRVLPEVLAAPDRKSANAVLLKWVNALGPVQPCNPCAKLNRLKLNFAPDLDWLSDQQLLGPELSRELQSIYTNRSNGPQFYVSLVPEIQNARLDHELPYANLKFPDFGFQLLALYRYWNAVEYWSPDRDIIGEDWNNVLRDSISNVGLAKDSDSYTRAMFALTARLHDGHSSLWTKLDLLPPAGKCQLPVALRFIDDQAVVTNLSPSASTELKVGDVLLSLDGVPVSKLVKDSLPYYSGSNDAARMRDLGKYITRGECGHVSLAVKRGGTDLNLSTDRLVAPAPIPGQPTHDLPGDTFRLLSKDVAYLKLSSVKASDAAKYLEQAQGTKGWIIDIRNYPSDFMVFDLGSHFVKERTDFATFTNGDLDNPGAFFWEHTEAISPAEPHYAGKIVILVDEVTMSSAEYTSMAFRAAPGAVVVGSTTSGADGNVSGITLPGGIHTIISGLGVYYPDHKPTQRVGIVPDIVAKPTIAGITAGRDEVLEVAIRQILGTDTPRDVVEKMTK